jgi:hypothetical protein
VLENQVSYCAPHLALCSGSPRYGKGVSIRDIAVHKRPRRRLQGMRGAAFKGSTVYSIEIVGGKLHTCACSSPSGYIYMHLNVAGTKFY